jgi:hypothetical protein
MLTARKCDCKDFLLFVYFVQSSGHPTDRCRFQGSPAGLGEFFVLAEPCLEAGHSKRQARVVGLGGGHDHHEKVAAIDCLGTPVQVAAQVLPVLVPVTQSRG